MKHAANESCARNSALAARIVTMATVTGTNAGEILDEADGVSDGADTISGLGGDDILVGSGGADTLDGGAGVDAAWYGNSSAGMTVNLATGVGTGGDAQGDTLINIENIVGSSWADFLIGDANTNNISGQSGNDTVIGGGGADTLWGNSGNDTLKGGGGADSLDGGLGYDTASYGDSTAGVSVSLIGDTAFGGYAEGDELNSIENLTGSPYADDLLGNNGVNVLKGMDGNDTLKGYGGNDTLEGGDDQDGLYGMDGVDVLHGDNGNDYLDGGDNNDNLDGGNSTDTLVGGLGEDTLTGGAGGDTFVFKSLADSTVAVPDDVMDFSAAAGDKIDLSQIDANTLVAGNQAFTWIGNDNAFVEAWGAGQLRFYGGLVEGDVDGDFVVDFRIQVTSPPLPETAFIL
jgi:Ca2+-binding RTX toxin-like protein